MRIIKSALSFSGETVQIRYNSERQGYVVCIVEFEDAGYFARSKEDAFNQFARWVQIEWGPSKRGARPGVLSLYQQPAPTGAMPGKKL